MPSGPSFSAAILTARLPQQGGGRMPIQGRRGCVLSTEGYFGMLLGAVPAFLVLYVASDQTLKRIAPRRTRPDEGVRDDGCWRRLRRETSGPLYWVTYLTYTPITAVIVAHLPLMGASFDCALEGYGEDCYPAACGKPRHRASPAPWVALVREAHRKL